MRGETVSPLPVKTVFALRIFVEIIQPNPEKYCKMIDTTKSRLKKKKPYDVPTINNLSVYVFGYVMITYTAVDY